MSKKKLTNLKYARKCDECEQGMNEGFVVNSGDEYYCSEECLHKHYTPKQWKKMYNDEDSDSYWTQWDDEEDFQFVEVDGELVDVDDL